MLESSKGQKKEVMQQGHYVPFGPSLAAAAMIMVFYDPLIRNFLYWWFVQGGNGPMPVMPYNVIGQSWIVPPLMEVVGWFNAISQKIVGA